MLIMDWLKANKNCLNFTETEVVLFKSVTKQILAYNITKMRSNSTQQNQKNTLES